MKKKSLLLFVILMLLLSCTKKQNSKLNHQKKVVNGIDNNPLYTVFKLDTVLTTFIDGGEDSLGNDDKNLIKSISDVVIDSKDNVYILEGSESKVHKYSENGEYLTTFGRKGNGPGEFVHSYSILLKNDTIYIPNNRSGKLMAFNQDGQFVRNVTPEEGNLPDKIFTIGDHFLGGVRQMKFNDGQGMSVKNLKIYDQNFNPLHTIYSSNDERDYSKPFNPTDDFIPFACSDKQIFVGLNSEDDYLINVYDEGGVKKQVIRKKFRKIPFTPVDMEQLKQSYHFSVNVNGKELEIKFKAKFKKAIKFMDADKYSRVWVYPSSDRKVIDKEEDGFYEIFEDGIFVAKVKIASNILFKNGKIIIYNYYNSKVRVYDY